MNGLTLLGLIAVLAVCGWVINQHLEARRRHADGPENLDELHARVDEALRGDREPVPPRGGDAA